MYQHDRTLEEKWWFYVEMFGGGGVECLRTVKLVYNYGY